MKGLEELAFFRSQEFYDDIGQKYGHINERCDVVEKELKALEIVKEHIKFEDSGIETYTDVSDNQVTKFLIKVWSKDTGATFHIHLDTQEQYDLLRKVLIG